MTALTGLLAGIEHALEAGGDLTMAGDDPDLALVAVLASVPATLRWYERNGVPAEVADATLRDLGAKLRLYGPEATGIDWLVKVVTGRVFTLGRLQFERGQRMPDGEPAYGLHVPELGPLDPGACDVALARARPFFATLGSPSAVGSPESGAPPARFAVCTSWLLDNQLAEYLPADSRILQFQRRFTPLPGGSPHGDHAHDGTAPADESEARHPGGSGGQHPGDAAVAKFIFRSTPERLTTATPRTRLEHAVVDHLASGRHWHETSGYLALH